MPFRCTQAAPRAQSAVTVKLVNASELKQVARTHVQQKCMHKWNNDCMQFSEGSYPSLPISSKPIQHAAANLHQAPAVPIQPLTELNTSALSHQQPQPVRRQVMTQQQRPHTHSPPSGSRAPAQPETQQPRQVPHQQPPGPANAPPQSTNRQPARKVYNPQVPAQGAAMPQQQRRQQPNTDWEALPEQQRRQPVGKVCNPQVPAQGASMPQQQLQQPPNTDW